MKKLVHSSLKCKYFFQNILTHTEPSTGLYRSGHQTHTRGPPRSHRDTWGGRGRDTGDYIPLPHHYTYIVHYR